MSSAVFLPGFPTGVAYVFVFSRGLQALSMSVHVVFKLSVCLSVHVVFKLSVCLSMHMVFKLSVCSSMHVVFKLSVCSSMHVVFKLSVCLSVHVVFKLSVCLCTWSSSSQYFYARGLQALSMSVCARGLKALSMFESPVTNSEFLRNSCKINAFFFGYRNEVKRRTFLLTIKCAVFVKQNFII